MWFEGIWFCFFRSLLLRCGKRGAPARELGLQRNDSYWIFQIGIHTALKQREDGCMD